jgi:tetratricopeptide (TPR) repeat protein
MWMKGRKRATTCALLLLLLLCPRHVVADDPAEGLFDEETGLWFPPGVTKESFIDGTAPRAYPLAVRDRLENDDLLRQRVCDWMSSPRNYVPREKTGQRVAQMKTMAQMLCAGIPVAQQAQKKRQEQEQQLEKEYREWLDLGAARKLDRATRSQRAQEHYLAIEGAPPEERLKLALGAIGLMPHEDAYLLEAKELVPYPSSNIGRHFEGFLRTLFTSESVADDEEGRRWRLGLRNLHYFSGEFAEARKITADAIERPFLSQHDYDRVYLAVLDRALGNRETWDGLLRDCPVPEVFRNEEPSAAAGHYCWTVARKVVWRGIRALGEKTPPALKEILVEGIAAEPTNWGDRMESIRALRRVDRRLAAQEAEAVLAIPATISPPGAQFDAVWALARIAQEEKNPSGALAYFDRYLDLIGFRLPEIKPDIWARLRAVGRPTSRNYKPPEDGAFVYIRQALDGKITVAVEAKLIGAARQAVAVRLAAEFERDATARKELEPFLRELAEAEPGSAAEAKKELEARLKESLEEAAEDVRYRLVEVGRSCQRTGDRRCALRIAGYLYSQPNEDGGPGTVTNLSSFKAELGQDGAVELKAEASPWDSIPAVAPRNSKR